MIDTITNQALGVAPLSTVGAYGIFAIDASGAWTYTLDLTQPAPGAGDVRAETFTAISQDGTHSGTVTITITGTSDALTLSSESQVLALM
jgi:VCBS repeat-containing protein